MENQRKQEHLDICLHQDVSSGISSNLARFHLMHCAAPELALSDIELATTFCEHRLAAPLLISAMTGGTHSAGTLNTRLARAAERYGLAMGVGSQRAWLEDTELASTFQVRAVAPNILLFANLGAVQLNYGFGVSECRRVVESIGADALVLHLNPLQEALQAGGNTDFRGLYDKIAEICLALGVPVIVKEVGWGLSLPVARRLLQAGVAALDVAGAGGTSWSQVESLRTPEPHQVQVAAAFRDWGIPTADALIEIHCALPEIPLIASGGITNGVQVATALALGAGLAGIALPLLRAADRSQDDLDEQLGIILEQLRIALFCTGSRTPADLQRDGVLEVN